MCDTPNRPVRNTPLFPTGHWGMAPFDRARETHWALKTMSGVISGQIIVLCVILPTGQWGTPHYSQPTTEEWLHLTAIWGTWNTLNIENHVWGAWCVISVCVIFPTGRPVRNTPLLQSGHWGMDAFDSTLGHVNDNKHWKPFRGA